MEAHAIAPVRAGVAQARKPGTIAKATHFGVPIVEYTLPGFEAHREGLLRWLLEKRRHDEGVLRSNVEGWHSGDRLQLEAAPGLRWVVDNVERIASLCIRDLEGPTFRGRVELVECWANVLDAGGWNVPHHHAPREWAACFYVHVDGAPPRPDGRVQGGDLLFLNPAPGTVGRRRQSFVHRRPTVGALILFPGDTVHMVAPHTDVGAPRVSISFNFRLTADGGAEDAQ